MNLIRRLGWAASFPPTLLLAGCATVWSRGIVQDSRGASVPGATVRVVEAQGSKLIAATRTDSNGCFIVGPFAAGADHHFELEIGAAGFTRATFAFDLQTPILFATLATSDAEPSAIHPATAQERTSQWEPLCALPPQPGASELSP